MKMFLSPWARDALTPAQRTLIWNAEPAEARLEVIGKTPDGPWWVRYADREVNVEARGADVVQTILDALAQANRADLEVVG